MARKRYSYHPACLLFPKLSREELQALSADIKVRGLLQPIVTYQEQILDGRNRLEACDLAGVEPRFVEWDGTGSPTEWAISANLFRRHLTSSQRAVVAYDLLPLLEQEAKQRQRLSKGRGKKGAQPCATFTGNGKASEVAARVTRTNARYVEIVKAINVAAPELVDRIRTGKLTVPEAKQLSELPSMQRAKALGALDSGRTYAFRRGDYTDKTHSSTVYTPPGICQFLHDTITAHYRVETILDPSAGEGALTAPWKAAKVVAFELADGRNFLSHRSRIHCDLVLCNPPFNSETTAARVFLPELFLQKIVELVGSKTPIVLFTPMGMRLNQHRDSRRWRWLRDKGPRITSIISLPLDVFEGVEFHSEILLFNMPKLQPHYFVPDGYLPRHKRPNRRRQN